MTHFILASDSWSLRAQHPWHGGIRIAPGLGSERPEGITLAKGPVAGIDRRAGGDRPNDSLAAGTVPGEPA